jgi:alpha/beta superfamily hydrolase
MAMELFLFGQTYLLLVLPSFCFGISISEILLDRRIQGKQYIISVAGTICDDIWHVYPCWC